MLEYKKIKLVIMDVDGTLTDGGIYYDAQGNEEKRFDVKDGLAIKVCIAAGLKTAIITGRKSPMVRRRAEELGIHFLVEGAQHKYQKMMDLLSELKLTLDEVCYIGDDLNDYQCMQAASVKMCPADAAKEIREICDFVSAQVSGHGAVRECLEELLTAGCGWRETWESIYFE